MPNAGPVSKPKWARVKITIGEERTLVQTMGERQRGREGDRGGRRERGTMNRTYTEWKLTTKNVHLIKKWTDGRELHVEEEGKKELWNPSGRPTYVERLADFANVLSS